MKELEKTQRISVVSTLFILAIVIGLLTFKRPKFIYDFTPTQTLEKIVSNDYLIGLDQINNPNTIIIDIRNQYEYDVAHLDKAINIHIADLLSDENTQLFEEIKNSGKTIAFYGNTPEEANIPFMILYQLGYTNLKIVTAVNTYIPNTCTLEGCVPETAKYDIAKFIAESGLK